MENSTINEIEILREQEKQMEEKKNILHFDDNLIDYLGEEMHYSITLMNHLKRECYDLCNKSYHPYVLTQAFICKSNKSYKDKEDDTTYYMFEFDNGKEFIASTYGLFCMAFTLSGYKD